MRNARVLGQRMTTAKTDAERARVMKDMERIQVKQGACIEKQMKDMQVLIANSRPINRVGMNCRSPNASPARIVQILLLRASATVH